MPQINVYFNVASYLIEHIVKSKLKDTVANNRNHRDQSYDESLSKHDKMQLHDVMLNKNNNNKLKLNESWNRNECNHKQPEFDETMTTLNHLLIILLKLSTYRNFGK